MYVAPAGPGGVPVAAAAIYPGIPCGINPCTFTLAVKLLTYTFPGCGITCIGYIAAFACGPPTMYPAGIACDG